MNNKCTVSDCDGITKVKGLCNKHYIRLVRHGDTNLRRVVIPTGGKCLIDGCDGIARGAGMCTKHYRRKKLYGDPMYKPDLTISIKDRLVSKIAVNNASGCWEFTGNKDGKGYGKLWNKGTMESAHRISYREHKGEIPSGLLVLHQCDNPCCVNPDHLFLGTHQENMADMVSKGRSKTKNRLIGSKNKMAKLSESDIPIIRSRLANGESCTEIAKAFLVNRSSVSLIKRGKIWTHV